MSISASENKELEEISEQAQTLLVGDFGVTQFKIVERLWLLGVMA
jgi:hypothetical protein